MYRCLIMYICIYAHNREGTEPARHVRGVVSEELAAVRVLARCCLGVIS